ncbi:hypothetical protein AMTR_s00015p00195810 [Amborella trichopoda]|uniref:Uncharacterized protein n=1 Tax=Amborella trichopoda TaxID=13333 RepID=W1PFV3_AMBTC|nr:hypothetical protein AMTR_s00015p00195810 [Amborella trichopoda]
MTPFHPQDSEQATIFKIKRQVQGIFGVARGHEERESESEGISTSGHPSKLLLRFFNETQNFGEFESPQCSAYDVLTQATQASQDLPPLPSLSPLLETGLAQVTSTSQDLPPSTSPPLLLETDLVQATLASQDPFLALSHPPFLEIDPFLTAREMEAFLTPQPSKTMEIWEMEKELSTLG